MPNDGSIQDYEGWTELPRGGSMFQKSPGLEVRGLGAPIHAFP